MHPVNHGGLGLRYAGQLLQVLADPPDRSNRADPEGPTRRGRPDPADFAGAADRRQGTLEQAIIEKAVDLLSGSGGLASFLRRRQLGARLGGPSLPLDIGYAETVPAGIGNAVILRDKRCRWAGGCNQTASACQVHHARSRRVHLARQFDWQHAAGGNTSLGARGTEEEGAPSAQKLGHSRPCRFPRSVFMVVLSVISLLTSS